MAQPARIVVLGGGFAGLWSAVGAARKAAELGLGPERLQVTLVNHDAFHGIRVRNYERALDDARVPLAAVLDPIGVSSLVADVIQVTPALHQVALVPHASGGPLTINYDRLVFALGSQLVKPDIPGLRAHAFDVDTYDAARRLSEHLLRLPSRGPSEARFSVVVVGAGLTGIEVATEMTGRLATLAQRASARSAVRVVLVDQREHVGSDMGPSARPAIESALAELRIEQRTGVSVTQIRDGRVTLSSGEELLASTVVWCAGMRAHPLTRDLGAQVDSLGRVPVDRYLRVRDLEHVFAAGDAAVCEISPGHASVMSCQHSRPMGRFAGHNVVCDLLGLAMLPLDVDWYVTVLDLGPAGALYTEGWERRLASTGARAKQTKETINRRRIYPPCSRQKDVILAAAAPVVQGRPR